jgi:hypothetical protein
MSSKKLVLSFMCKNEEKVILNMLNSVKNIVDNIVALDTGSNDNTINIIKNFCIINQIPFEIYHHVFDNFCNSRNLLKKYTVEYINAFYKGQDLNNIYWFSIDCDDEMIIDENFNKEVLTDNIYDIKIDTNYLSYRKPSIVKATDTGEWQGIFHETYVGITPASFFNGMYIKVNHAGESWNENNKHLLQALKYENYINNNTYTIRDLFYTGETFLLAKHYNKSIEYFNRLIKEFEVNDENREYIMYSYLQLEIFALETEDYGNGIIYAIKANEADTRRIESFYFLILHLIKKQKIFDAYIFSKYLKTYSGKNPFPECKLYVFENMYNIHIDSICNSIETILINTNKI